MKTFTTELRKLEAAATEGPVFVGRDIAHDCPLHKDSGLALIDTGRTEDYPVARLCEWHNANLLAFLRNHANAIIALVEAAEKMRAHHGSCQRAMEQCGTNEALAALEAGG